nr:DUF1949 domain-containing protein [Saccharopolyspora dendranthemae]
MAGRVDNDLRSAGYQVADTSYDASVRFQVNVPVEEFRTWLAATTAGAAEPSEGPLIHAELSL